ncbi:Origin recognition complex, subunit 1 [Gonapodya sp. JEL0774]|nr:Origin recognition complex, subunit 1 [Gonapodya sp. JEL0774]
MSPFLFLGIFPFDSSQLQPPPPAPKVELRKRRKLNRGASTAPSPSSTRRHTGARSNSLHSASPPPVTPPSNPNNGPVVWEEYTWAGVTRIRATALLEGGFAAHGFATSGRSSSLSTSSEPRRRKRGRPSRSDQCSHSEPEPLVDIDIDGDGIDGDAGHDAIGPRITERDVEDYVQRRLEEQREFEEWVRESMEKETGDEDVVVGDDAIRKGLSKLAVVDGELVVVGGEGRLGAVGGEQAGMLSSCDGVASRGPSISAGLGTEVVQEALQDKETAQRCSDQVHSGGDGTHHSVLENSTTSAVFQNSFYFHTSIESTPCDASAHSASAAELAAHDRSLNAPINMSPLVSNPAYPPVSGNTLSALRCDTANPAITSSADAASADSLQRQLTILRAHVHHLESLLSNQNIPKCLVCLEPPKDPYIPPASSGPAKTQYTSFTAPTSSQPFRPGDFVQWGSPEGEAKYLGILREVFEDEEGKVMVKIRPTFVLAADPFTKVSGKKRNNLEAFYFPGSAVHPIECILGHCRIVADQSRAKKESTEELPVYFCRSEYAQKKGLVQLTPLVWDDMVRKDFPEPEAAYKISISPVKRTTPKKVIPSERKTTTASKSPTAPVTEIDEGNLSDCSGETPEFDNDDDAYEESDAEATDDETLMEGPVASDEDSESEVIDEFADSESDGEERVSGRKRKAIGKPVPKAKKPRITAKKTDVIYALPNRLPVLPVAAGSEYEEMRKRLHVSAVPETLPCRENELAHIIEQLDTAIERKRGCCLYISGVPGTGKTATVREALRFLQARSDAGEMQPFYAVEINGMKLTEPQQAYAVLWEALTDTKVTANHAAELLEKRFKSPRLDMEPIVVVMDELDLLVTPKQNVIYSFFDWPNRPNSNLIVVAIANTMDLPERLLTNRISSRLGLKRMNFQPYTFQQLSEIVQSRLVGIDVFDKDAIEFVARKVSAVSGDARRALDICRRTVELVEQEKTKALAEEGALVPSRITIRAVQRAVSELFTTSNVSSVQRGSLHQKIFLVALANRVRRRGVPDIEMREVSVLLFPPFAPLS